MTTVTVILTRKTKASAEREAAWFTQAEPETHPRVIKQDGLYYVVRDVHPSDEGRTYTQITL